MILDKEKKNQIRSSSLKKVFIAIFFLIIFYIVLYNHNIFLQTTSIKSQEINISSAFDTFEFLRQNIREFLEFGKKTDKTFGHHYETIYGNLLGPLRNKNLNFLEIGLGCTMHKLSKDYGPGVSLELWRRYLPNANISIFEYDETCALKFKDKVENLIIGDQTNISFVQNMGKKYGPFDFIADDGCHLRNCQINAFVGFWPYVKSKGIYLIEDLNMSKINENGRTKTSLDLIFRILLLFNNFSPSDLNLNQVVENQIEKYAKDIVRQLESIHCYKHACAFIKK